MRDYRKYEVWVRSHELVLFVYGQIAREFPMEERFGLTSQLKRAACSIPLLIVEGCGRNTDKAFAHFLDMSLGSAQELEYCILLARDMKILKDETYALAYEKINEVKAKLINLIKALRKAERQTSEANDQKQNLIK